MHLTWNGKGPGCSGLKPITIRESPIAVFFYAYSENNIPFANMNPGLSLLLSAILWDSIILLLTVAGLWRQHAPRSSRLWTMLSRQGVGYLVVTLCVNIPMLVSMILDKSGVCDGCSPLRS